MADEKEVPVGKEILQYVRALEENIYGRIKARDNTQSLPAQDVKTEADILSILKEDVDSHMQIYEKLSRIKSALMMKWSRWFWKEIKKGHLGRNQSDGVVRRVHLLSWLDEDLQKAKIKLSGHATVILSSILNCHEGWFTGKKAYKRLCECYNFYRVANNQEPVSWDQGNVQKLLPAGHTQGESSMLLGFLEDIVGDVLNPNPDSFSKKQRVSRNLIRGSER